MDIYYRIWKQGGELDFMNCRRACISRWLPNVIFVNDGRRVTLSGEPRSEAPKHLGDSAIYVGRFDAFDLVATPIHEFDVPSIGSVLITATASPHPVGYAQKLNTYT